LITRTSRFHNKERVFELLQQFIGRRIAKMWTGAPTAAREQIFGLMFRVLSQYPTSRLCVWPVSAQYLVEANNLRRQARYLTPKRNE